MIIDILMKKQLDLYEEFMMRRFYFRAICFFYSVYNIACAYLNYNEKPEYTLQRQKIWNKWFSTFPVSNPKYFKKMQKFVETDSKIISDALNKINSLVENSEEIIGDLYRPGTIGMLAYEYYKY